MVPYYQEDGKINTDKIRKIAIGDARLLLSNLNKSFSILTNEITLGDRPKELSDKVFSLLDRVEVVLGKRVNAQIAETLLSDQCTLSQIESREQAQLALDTLQDALELAQVFKHAPDLNDKNIALLELRIEKVEEKIKSLSQ